MSIAREGYSFIVPAALLAVIAFALSWKSLGFLFLLIALAFVGFFRDPERVPPAGEGLILAPADGKVVGILEVQKGVGLEEAGTRISIFLSPLDVHINRAPVEGKIEEVRHQKGKFFAAYKDVASQRNEQNSLKIVDPQGRKLGVVQIAGIMARRIICYVTEGQSLEKGQRFGLIMFGSRVDLFLPKDSRIEVVEGQRVRAGETIVARFV